MKNVTKKGLCLFAASSLLVTGLFAGCKPKDEGSTDSGDGQLKKATVRLVMAGEKPKDQDKVFAEIEKRVADTLNIDLEADYFPWTDYSERVKMLNAGREEFDIFLNFGNDIAAAYDRKQAIKLNDEENNLFEKYGKDIKANIPEMELKAGYVGDDMVAIPAVYTKDSIATTMLVRKDLREKYNLPEITDLESFAAYCDAIVKNEKNMIPIASTAYNYTTQLVRAVSDNRPSVYASVAMCYVDDKEDSFVVKNRYEMHNDVELMKLGARAYQSGWVEKDVLSQKDANGLFTSGKAAVIGTDYNQFSVLESTLKKSNPEAEVEWVILNPDMPVSYEKSNNYSQISTTSKNPERAMMFLNWLQADQANYDLYMFGIEGTHYTLEGDLIKLPDGIDATNNPYAPTPWFAYNTKYHRLTTADSQLTVDAVEYFKNAQRFPVNEDMLGFSFDTEPVSMEIGQCDKIIAEQWYPMLAGVVSGEDAYNKFIADLKTAGSDKIIAEFQKQVDEYRKNIK